MSIRYKLLFTMIALSLVAIAVSSLLAYVHATRSLKDAVLRGLTGSRHTRAYEIEKYFRIVGNHVDSLSDDRMFLEGVQKFSLACRKLRTRDPELARARLRRYYEDLYLPVLRRYMPLKKKPADYLPADDVGYILQDRYLVEPTEKEGTGRLQQTGHELDEYARVHAQYDGPIRKLTAQFGYDDLLLIEPKDLRVVYSVKKKPDFGTSLRFGPYRDTALAEIVNRAAEASDRDAIFASDFTSYEPSRGAPAAFVASPIFDGETGVGVFAMQLSKTTIDALVSGNRGWERDGLGDTGDMQIVGADGLMRSTSREFLEQPQRVLKAMRQRGASETDLNRIQAYGTTILQESVTFAAVDKARQGREGTTVELDKNGRQVFVSFMPLKTPGLNWVFLSRIDVDEVMAPVRRFERAAALWTIIAILLTTLVALVTTDRMLKPIRALVNASTKLSAGDLGARVAVYSNDELGRLSSTFNSMADNIQRSLELIRDKNRENENLLLNILPLPIAERLKGGETVIADHHADVTVLFADIVGFTTLSASREPGEIVALLNGLFTQFDISAKKHGIEKIKTIGDAYMAVSGLPDFRPDHAKRTVEMALNMLDAVKSYAIQLEQPIAIRIGINSGPVAAGIVGTTKFIYDLWGDTVNMASRMESTGMPGAIQVTRTVYEPLKSEYSFEARGAIEIKGKGPCETWLLRPPEAGQCPETSIEAKHA